MVCESALPSLRRSRPLDMIVLESGKSCLGKSAKGESDCAKRSASSLIFCGFGKVASHSPAQ